jgi:phage gp36-like protein
MLAAIEYLSKEASEKEIDQLSDLGGAGTRNDGIIADAFEYVEGFIASFIKIPAQPTILLRQIAARLALIELRRKNEIYGDKEKELQKECETYLKNMAAGKIPTEIDEQIDPVKANQGAYKHNYPLKIDTAGYVL